MRVPGHDWLYAIGDVNGRALFTHMGKYQARIAADHILGNAIGGRPRRRRPALAARDLHRAAGRRRRPHDEDRAARPGSTSTSSRPRRRATPAARSTAATRPARPAGSSTASAGSIVGATITGAEIADFLHAATIAIVGEVPLDRLRHAMPAFPTRSEIWLYLFNELGI